MKIADCRLAIADCSPAGALSDAAGLRLLPLLLSVAIAGCAALGRHGAIATQPPEAAVTAFDAAVAAGDLDAMRTLLKEHPSLVNTADPQGGTPLHAATFRGDKAAVELLLSKGADVNAQKKDGWTALHFAAVNGRADIAQLLLKKGATVDAKKTDGGTPLHAAVMEGHKDIVELLIAQGADVNAKKTDGWTPLRFATWKNRTEIADILKKNGAKE